MLGHEPQKITHGELSALLTPTATAKEPNTVNAATLVSGAVRCGRLCKWCGGADGGWLKRWRLNWHDQVAAPPEHAREPMAGPYLGRGFGLPDCTPIRRSGKRNACHGQEGG
ncbi:MAG TPA: hypothetical protein DD670_07630 [Planctomycetaceae bacterium]|nr:hypothetical protein [Planctomycetaceae bacterium]